MTVRGEAFDVGVEILAIGVQAVGGEDQRRFEPCLPAVGFVEGAGVGLGILFLVGGGDGGMGAIEASPAVLASGWVAD